ncbi:MAG TPA: hypothetical protein EYP03_04925 [Aquificae bacterium]|nr:hypothetical protein [Aquificota bacterium]
MVIEAQAFKYSSETQKEVLNFLSKFPRNPDIFLFFSKDDVKISTILSLLKKIYPSTPVIGSTVEGLILNKSAYETNKMFLIIALFLKKGKVIPFKFENATNNEEKAGLYLQSLISNNTSFIFLFVESIATNVGKILSTFDIKYKNIPIFGFASGDSLEFKNTYQIFDLNIYTNSMVGLIFEGDFYYNYMLALKTKPLFDLIITESEEIFIKKINNKKALDFVGEILEKADIKEKVPLQFLFGLKLRNKKRSFTPISINYEEKFFQILEEVPSRTEASFVVPDENERLNDIKLKLNLFSQAVNFSYIQAGFISSCAGCGKILYDDSEEEIKHIWEKFDCIPIFGTFNFGPIFPIKNGNKVSNFTTTFFVFGEK